MPYEIEATAVSSAPPEEIFKHLAVAEAWSEWGRFPSKARRERAGTDTPNGVGAVRAIGPAREEVVAYDPPRHYAYVATAGLPVRDYRADVTLEPQGSNTLIRWKASFEPKIPGSAPAVRFVINRLLTSFSRRVARHSERCEPGCPARLPV
ncbi:SRPBCC family protein [Spirillospora sp. NPDC047279]|uniref:SRPBCC family protein n=1 Tax=Spirillospora sp. NPDC047279 TaxID=3155478 RepID=UPI0033DDE801